MRTPKRSRGRLESSRGAIEPILTHPKNDGFRAFNQVLEAAYSLALHQAADYATRRAPRAARTSSSLASVEEEGGRRPLRVWEEETHRGEGRAHDAGARRDTTDTGRKRTGKSRGRWRAGGAYEESAGLREAEHQESCGVPMAWV